MNLQEIINNFSFTNFLSFECIDLPFQTSSCSGFWFNYVILAEIIGLVVVYKLVTYFLNERKVFKAFNERQVRKAMVAEDEVMDQLKWKGDADFNDLDQGELSQKMRNELAKKHKTDQ